MKNKIEHNIQKLYTFRALRDAMVVMPIITLFFQENGLSMQDIFVLQAVFAVTMVLFEIPSGFLSDIIGHRKSLVLGSALTVLGVSVYVFAYGFWLIMLAEIILGIGYAFFSGADSALLYNSLTVLGRESEHKKIESRLLSIGGISAAVGGVLGGLLATISLRIPFIIEVLIVLPMVPLALSFTEPAIKRLKTSRKDIWKDMKKIIHYSLHGHKKLKWIILYAAAINTSTLVFVWMMQPYWKLVGVPLVWFGVLWAVLNLAIAVFAPLAHNLEDMIGLRKSLVLFVMLVAITYFILGAFPLLYTVPVILVFYFVRAVQQPILRDYVHKIIESDVRATVLSIQALAGRSLYIIVGPIIGYMIDTFSLPSALIISGALFFVLGIIPLLFLWKHKGI